MDQQDEFSETGYGHFDQQPLTQGRQSDHEINN
jgi:hypothetical protein